jgi:hypothetical protein
VQKNFWRDNAIGCEEFHRILSREKVEIVYGKVTHVLYGLRKVRKGSEKIQRCRGG